MLNIKLKNIPLHKIILTGILLILMYISFNYCFGETLDEDELYCNSDLIMDLESGNVLYAKNGYKKVYPASTTKILTAILALENLDLNESVVASAHAVYSTPIGSSVIYLQPQEVMSVKNLLYGLLIPSGNDAGNVIAEAVSGDIGSFVELMNKKLKELGCNNTHFTNAHGFHDDNHYTTVYDMAKLMRYALKNDTFREIIETKEYTIPATNKSEERELVNTNKMFNKKYTKMYYEYILGGKTGYTEEARGTFIGYGTKDGKSVIVCAFDGSQNIQNGQEGRFLDSKTLFEYAFENFNKFKIFDKNNIAYKVKDENTSKEYTLSLDSDKYALYAGGAYSTKYDINNIATNLEDKNLNDKVGIISLSAKGNAIDIQNDYDLILTSKNNYFNTSNILKYIEYILTILLFIILIREITKLIKLNKKNKNIYNNYNDKKINNVRKI